MDALWSSICLAPGDVIIGSVLRSATLVERRCRRRRRNWPALLLRVVLRFVSKLSHLTTSVPAGHVRNSYLGGVYAMQRPVSGCGVDVIASVLVVDISSSGTAEIKKQVDGDVVDGDDDDDDEDDDEQRRFISLNRSKIDVENRNELASLCAVRRCCCFFFAPIIVSTFDGITAALLRLFLSENCEVRWSW